MHDDRRDPRVAIHEVPASRLADYARVSIAFTVREVVDSPRELVSVATPALRTRAVSAPYLKNYDALDDGPEGWPARFDVGRWIFLLATSAGGAVGAAALVVDAPGIDMLASHPAGALLWDIRVAPEARGRGVGRRLLEAVETRARRGGARVLLVETQDINVGACRFYAANGFELSDVQPNAYPGLPDEIQLVWRKPLYAG